jgi:hypothetical protein
MTVEINYLAVIVATAASMVIGFIWYHPSVFGKAWLKFSKIDPRKGSMAWATGAAVVSSFVMAFVLAHVIFLSHSFFQNSFMQDSLATAFWVWFGFQGLRVFQRDQFNQRRKKESLIHIGNDLVTIMAMGLIIGAFGV